MARSSHLTQVVRGAAVGLPVLAPPRDLFRRWGAVAPLSDVETGPAPAARRAAASDLQDFNTGAPATSVRPSQSPRIQTPVKTAAKRDAEIALPEEPAAVSTSQPAADSRSNHPQDEIAAVASSRQSEQTVTPVPHRTHQAPAPATQFIRPVATPKLSDRPTSERQKSGNHTAPLELSQTIEARPAPAPQSIATSKPVAPAREIASPLMPAQRAPLAPLPAAVRSKERKEPIIRIGWVEVHITPPSAPPPAVRTAAAVSRPAPLSRELISAFGLRQG